MSETSERLPGKLGGRMSLTAWKLRQDRLANTENSSSQPPTEDGEPESIPETELFFDPWLRMSGWGSGLAGIIMQPVGYGWMLQKYEEADGPRRRAMSSRDREAMERTVGMVVANLALAITTKRKPPAIGVSLRAARQGATRYDRAGLSNLPRVLEAFSSVGARRGPWRLIKSKQRGVPSAVIAEEELLGDNLRYHSRYGSLTPAAFYREPGFETIILRRTKRDFIDDTRSREWIDYTDTPQSIQFRDELATMNAHLRAADIGFEPDGGEAVPTLRKDLRRFFSLLEGDQDDAPRFDQGGRLFDGWWQTLAKERRGSIRVEGEPVADLDFANMFLRLAYLDAGHEPPAGDLYASIPGLSEPYWRDGVKVLVNAMLFRSTPMQRLPRDPGLRKKLPPGAKGSVMREAILAGHPLLRDTFETGAGHRLMFVESQILVRAMLKMIDAGITALPMHDGSMVPRSKHAEAAECMAEASQEVTGYRLPIVLKSLFN